MSSIKKIKINEKKKSNNNEWKQRAFTLCEGKGIFIPFQGLSQSHVLWAWLFTFIVKNEFHL